MAGVFPGGGANRFREGIRFAMEMGAPPEEANQATFTFPPVLEYVEGEEVDSSGVPFDPTVPVRETRPDPVRVPCAIEYYDERGQQTSFGDLHATRVKVLLLDEEHEKVEGCDAVLLGGDRYLYRYTTPPSGLFSVGIFELWFHAEIES